MLSYEMLFYVDGIFPAATNITEDQLIGGQYDGRKRELDGPWEYEFPISIRYLDGG